MQVLVVNPGSTTTKLAIYSPSGPLIEKTITHKTKMLTAFPDVTLQLAARLDDVSSAMKESGMRLTSFRRSSAGGLSVLLNPAFTQ